MIGAWEEFLSLLETDKPWNEIHRFRRSTSSAFPRIFAMRG